MASACVRDEDYTDNRDPGLLAVAMRRLVSLVGDTIEDAVGLLIGAAARVGRVRGSAGVRAPDRHEHLAVRERLARGSRVTMALTPRRCRFPRVARVGPHGLRGEREGLAEKIDLPQLALRAVAQREVL